MSGDLFLIILVGLSLVASVGLRRRADLMLRNLREQRFRLAAEIARAQQALARGRTREARARQQIELAEAEIERRERDLANIEEQLHEMTGTQTRRLHVLDRAQIRGDKLWVVSFLQEAGGGDSEFARLNRWDKARHFVLSAKSVQEAEERVRMRYPGISGYRLQTPRPLSDIVAEAKATPSAPEAATA
ncbi:MAG TPA: hypothetical protein VEY95_08600 [Azospirillaceae bacterium]|nr:hypothetical protein [Azospirillaceae bacterium]